MPRGLFDQFDDKPTLFQVMAWCRHARSHYLNPCWVVGGDLRRHMVWQGHKELSPKADFRTVLGLTHWGRATHICFGKLTTIGSDNGLPLGQRQAIIWTIAGILLIGPLGTNFSEILIGIRTFSLKKMHLKMASAKWRPFVSASTS